MLRSVKDLEHTIIESLQIFHAEDNLQGCCRVLSPAKLKGLSVVKRR